MVVLLDPFELDLAGAFGAALVGMASGQMLVQHGGGHDADLFACGFVFFAAADRGALCLCLVAYLAGNGRSGGEGERECVG